MTAIDNQPAQHEIEERLPWYATGTLSGRDAERVAQALAGDHELAQRYELVRRELAEATRLNETLGAPSARAMEKLFAAINAEEACGDHDVGDSPDTGRLGWARCLF
jgi:hypothetical protein